MVEFSRYVQNRQLKKKEEEFKDFAPIRGTFLGWYRSRHWDGTFGKVDSQECEWEISEYLTTSNPNPWIALRITKGGVTGWESFILEDEHGPDLRTLAKWAHCPYWSACAGTPGSWKEMRVAGPNVRDAIRQYLEQKDLLISVCQYCHEGVGIKSAEGAGGGWSDTICDGCLDVNGCET